MARKRYYISQYLPIWNQLKTDKHVAIAVPRPLHARVIKAVIKRKNEDLAYKFLLGEEGKRARMEYTVEGDKITFKLTMWIGTGIGEL